MARPWWRSDVAARTIPLGRMACEGCDGTYAVGFMRCPHCQTRSPLYPERIATSGRMPSVVDGSVLVVEDDDPVPAVKDAVPVRRPRGRPRKVVVKAEDGPAQAGPQVGGEVRGGVDV